jgi:hypothetical protein
MKAMQTDSNQPAIAALFTDNLEYAIKSSVASCFSQCEICNIMSIISFNHNLNVCDDCSVRKYYIADLMGH